MGSMTEIRNDIRRILLLFIVAIMMMPWGVAFAEPDDVPEDADEPVIKTTARVRDVLVEKDNWSIATEQSPAYAFPYTEIVLNREAQARIEKEEKELQEKTKKRAAQEAKTLAMELVENGRYKEVMGYSNRYEKDWEEYSEDYDEDEDEDIDEDPDEDYDEDEDIEEDPDEGYDEDEDYSDEEDEEEDVKSDGPYYGKLGKRYPTLEIFWFEKDGSYHYEYYIDDSGIDYSDLYDYIDHFRFNIRDTLEYRGLRPGMKYDVEARLVTVKRNDNIDPVDDEPVDDPGNDDTNDDPGNDESADSKGKSENLAEDVEVRKVNVSFVASETGNGTMDIDFGEVEFAASGIMVIRMKITSEDGTEEILHDDLDNDLESIMFFVEKTTDGSNAPGKAKNNGIGMIKFPGDPTDKTKDKSPDTGDWHELNLIMVLLIAAGLMILLVPMNSRRTNRND